MEEEKDLLVEEEKTCDKKPKKRLSFFSRLRAKRNKKLEELNRTELSEEETKKVEEKIIEINKDVEKKSSKHKKLKNGLMFAFNILLVIGILVWNVFSSDDFTPLKLFDINYWFVLVALLFMLGILVVDVFSIHRMIYRRTLRSRWSLSYKSMAVLKYYDSVTPMSSGGQSFMAVYLMGRDIPGATAASVPMAKLVFQQLSWLMITFICLIISFTNGMSSNGLVSATSIIGFIIVVIVVSFILTVSLSKKVGTKMVSWVIKILVKLRIVKDYDAQFSKTMSFIEDYQNIMKEYSKSIFDVIYQLVLHGLRYFFLFSIPFFIYCAFQGFDSSKFGEFFLYTALIDLSSSFIPLPGGTGMNEITFTVLFNQYLGGGTFWALLLWRFCSYYIYLLQGIGVIAYDTIYGNRKYRWVKKRLALQGESQEFKRLQIENFRLERNKRRKKQKKTIGQE